MTFPGVTESSKLISFAISHLAMRYVSSAQQYNTFRASRAIRRRVTLRQCAVSLASFAQARRVVLVDRLQVSVVATSGVCMRRQRWRTVYDRMTMIASLYRRRHVWRHVRARHASRCCYGKLLATCQSCLSRCRYVGVVVVGFVGYKGSGQRAAGFKFRSWADRDDGRK